MNSVSPSFHSLLCRSNVRGVDATVKFATAAPDGVNRSSGSPVMLPMTVMMVSPPCPAPCFGRSSGKVAAQASARRTLVRRTTSLRPSWRSSSLAAAGARVSYEALVLALGARPRTLLPGAITYRGLDSNTEVHQALLAIDRGESTGLVFAVPATVNWSLPLYELALLAAAHLEDIGDRGASLDLVTAESQPLSVFGREVSGLVRSLLRQAGVRLHAGVAPARRSGEGLNLMDGSLVRCDQVIALPGSEVAAIAGLPQGPHGFIDTDSLMRVGGRADLYAVGDASWFPINQGGLAAQQADVAATAIAASIDPKLDPAPFQPRLRAALLTGRARSTCAPVSAKASRP